MTHHVNSITNPIATKFKEKPARTIWEVVILPEPNTIALGGVATGSMNAQLAATVAGITNK